MSWEPIEKCPRDGRFFWVSNEKTSIPMLANWIDRADSVCIYPVDKIQGFNKKSALMTHWIPIPAPPTN